MSVYDLDGVEKDESSNKSSSSRKSTTTNTESKKSRDYELIDELVEHYAENDSVDLDDFDSNSNFTSSDEVTSRFDSWERALKLAGLEDKQKIHQKFSW